MIVAIPPDMPVTTPFDAVTWATAVLLLLHEPPAEASLRIVLPPWHTVVFPVIGIMRFTVTIVVATQPANEV